MHDNEIWSLRPFSFNAGRGLVIQLLIRLSSSLVVPFAVHLLAVPFAVHLLAELPPVVALCSLSLHNALAPCGSLLRFLSVSFLPFAVHLSADTPISLKTCPLWLPFAVDAINTIMPLLQILPLRIAQTRV